jgi:hypothetical protein
MSNDLREFKQKLLTLSVEDQLALLEHFYSLQNTILLLKGHEKAYRW